MSWKLQRLVCYILSFAVSNFSTQIISNLIKFAVTLPNIN